MTLFELLMYNTKQFQSNYKEHHPCQVDAALTDHDLAHLADWASELKDLTPNPSWKRAYALIREGSDMLLRRRSMSRAEEINPANVAAYTLVCGCIGDCAGHQGV